LEEEAGVVEVANKGATVDLRHLNATVDKSWPLNYFMLELIDLDHLFT